MNPPDLYQLAAQERGVPAGWHWYEIKAIGENREHGAIVIKGAVCIAKYAKGPKAGKTNWSKRDKTTEREILVTFKDLDRIRDQWERDNLACSQCAGSGLEVKSYSATEGKTMGPCRRCKERRASP